MSSHAWRKQIPDAPLHGDDVPSVLYHVTPVGNLAAILEEGLLPRTRALREDHPPRVYLTPSPAQALSLCWQLRWAMVDKKVVKRNWRDDFVILGIRPDIAGVTLRWDGSSLREGGVYTDEAITPDAVRLVETVDGKALLSGNTTKVWDWAIWGRPRPPCIERLGCLTGIPGHTGWHTEECHIDKPLDLDALWEVAPGPKL